MSNAPSATRDELQRLLTETAEPGYRNYWKSDYLARLPDEAIDTVVDHRAWAQALSTAMESYTTDGVYVNFLSQEGEGRVEAAHGDNYDRLAAVKAE